MPTFKTERALHQIIARALSYLLSCQSSMKEWWLILMCKISSKICRLTCGYLFLQVFIACGLGGSSGQAADAFRKPNLGMWHIMERHFNSGISIDMDQLLFHSLYLLVWFPSPVITKLNKFRCSILFKFLLKLNWILISFHII